MSIARSRCEIAMDFAFAALFAIVGCVHDDPAESRALMFAGGFMLAAGMYLRPCWLDCKAGESHLVGADDGMSDIESVDDEPLDLDEIDDSDEPDPDDDAPPAVNPTTGYPAFPGVPTHIEWYDADKLD